MSEYRYPPDIKLLKLYRLKPEYISPSSSSQESYTTPLAAWNNGGLHRETWFVGYIEGNDIRCNSIKHFLKHYELVSPEQEWLAEEQRQLEI